MASTFSDIIFFVCAAAILLSQAFILRSTARGMKYDGTQNQGARTATPGRTTLEWLYAIVPAFALVALLIFAWRAMHPELVRVRGIAPPGIGAAQ